MKLFSSYELKGKTIKNRLVVPAMVTNYCTEDGKATEQYIAYHEAKAKGGWGLIITEDYAVDPLGRGFKFVAGLWNDEQIESHKELPKRVKQHGSTIIAQIYHCGRQTSSPVIGATPVAPSAIQCPFGIDIPKELTIEEIKKIVGQFGDTAYRAKQCGFDGVEIHGGHGYLIAQFMSSYSNKRVDEYGGSLVNRVKFPLEIVQDIRKKCGNDFIIGFRISVDEFIEGGRTVEDSKVIAKMLQDAGVDMIHASAGVYASADAVVPPNYVRHGWIVDLAKEIKSVCDIPVITVGRINEPQLANSIIESGKADFVGMARSSLTDPDMPNKAKDGHFEDIRQCIGCNVGCLGLLFANEQIKCVLNPELGIEYKDMVKKASTGKKIAIVGAGPAGLEAAIYAAKAGHAVTVFEKNDIAGGQFYWAAIPPSKGEISAFTVWQTTQLKKLGVEIKYNTTVTSEFFDNNSFDEIIVATGAMPAPSSIKGAELAINAVPVLAGKVQTGANVVIIGGGQVGAETANHLAVHLKAVTLIEATGAIASHEALAPRWHLLRALEGRKVNMMVNTEVLEIKKDGVTVKNANGTVTLPADTVIIAAGAVENNALATELKSKGLPVTVIGDADKVGRVLEAVAKGFEIGLSL